MPLDHWRKDLSAGYPESFSSPLGHTELWGSGCLDTKHGFPESDNSPESNFWKT